MTDPRRCETQLSDLPMDVISSIADRIRSFGDCVRLDCVIRGFADGSSSSSSRRQLQKLRKFPWLVIEVNETTKILCFFSGHIFFPVHTRLNAIRCAGSFFGWLFMADRGLTVSADGEKRYLNIFLLNPCTNQRIQLPRRFSFGIKKVVMSDTDGELLAVTGGSSPLALCKLGDEEWSLRDSPTRFTCNDIIFFKGVLYAVDYYSEIMAIDFHKPGAGGMQERILPIKRHPKSYAIPNGQYSRFFLVESDGELLLVVEQLQVSCRDADGHRNACACYDKAVHFSVLMLDFSGPRWVELTNLGNRMLLLDWICTVSVDAVNLSRFGFRANCIYYTNYGDPDDYGWHEFCLEDNKIVPFGCNFSTLLQLLPYVHNLG